MTRLFLVSNWNQKGPDPFLEWPGHHYSFWRWRKKPHKYHECRAMLLPKYRIYTNYFKILGGWELRTYPAGRSSLVSKAGMRLPRPLHSEFWLRTPGMKLQLRRIYWPSAPFHGQVFRQVLPCEVEIGMHIPESSSATWLNTSELMLGNSSAIPPESPCKEIYRLLLTQTNCFSYLPHCWSTTPNTYPQLKEGKVYSARTLEVSVPASSTMWWKSPDQRWRTF